MLLLAKAVLGEPNLLLLDEPGNHLDFDGLHWLESYLEGFSGAIVVVSHNRYLLDRVAEETWHVSAGTITRYAGGYSDYRFASLRNLLSAQAEHAAQQKTLSRMRDLVRTFEERARVTADPKWGKRLRARRTQLQKLEEQAIDKPELDAQPLQIDFHREASKSDIAVEVRHYSRSIGGQQLLSDTGFLVHTGDRVGIVGPNGCGKTTFLRDLVSEGSWEHSSLRITPSQVLGYCAQHRDRFPGSMTILDAMLSAGVYTRHAVFGVLSRLRFAWEDLDRTVATLSGGEWNRLQIGIAILGKANLLILDEPTNHLDIPSREAVEEAMEEFAGTVITVSHDRYFLSAVARRIVEIRDRQFIQHDESVTEFLSRAGRRHGSNARRSGAGDAAERLAERGRTLQATRHTGSGSAGTRRENDDRGTEQQIVALEAQRGRLEAAMARAFEKRDYREGRRLRTELEKVASRIDELYEQWGAQTSP